MRSRGACVYFSLRHALEQKNLRHRHQRSLASDLQSRAVHGRGVSPRRALFVAGGRAREVCRAGGHRGAASRRGGAEEPPRPKRPRRRGEVRRGEAAAWSRRETARRRGAAREKNAAAAEAETLRSRRTASRWTRTDSDAWFELGSPAAWYSEGPERMSSVRPRGVRAVRAVLGRVRVGTAGREAFRGLVWPAHASSPTC